MRTNKFISAICLILALLFCLMSCNGQTTPPETQPTVETPAQTECAHNYVENGTVPAMALKDGEKKFICSLCSAERSEPIPATKSLKVLAIGNSFTIDGMQHLWNICKSGGVEEIVLGNLHIGSCTISIHWNNIKNNNKAYTYYKNTNNIWTNKKQTAFLDTLKDEEWDIVVLNQASGDNGFGSTYKNMDNIIQYVKENSTNPDVSFAWHMGWAYQQDCTRANFSKYNNDQLKMYQMISSTVKEVVLPKQTVSAIIPAGTAIQNLRTSYVGDTLTRDGYHLSYTTGRYTAALTWFCILTGGTPEQTSWTPSGTPAVKDDLTVIRESVTNAVNTPFEATESKYKTAP